MLNAMIIDVKDNVAVAIEPITKGETITYRCEGEEVTLTAAQDIIIYHKNRFMCLEIIPFIGILYRPTRHRQSYWLCLLSGLFWRFTDRCR